MTPAYEVLCETYRLGEAEFDCKVERAHGARSLTWFGKEPPDVEEVIVVGARHRLDRADLPANQLGWPVISRALWTALGRPGHAVNVRVREHEDGPEVLPGRFVAFHLAPVPDVFDRVVSLWDEDSVFPGEVGLVRRLRFRPDVALPSVFRMLETPSRLFVSRRRRIRLLDCATVGVRFEPVGGA